MIPKVATGFRKRSCSNKEVERDDSTRSHRALDDEEQKQRHEQREDAERLGHREAEDQPRELAVGGRRVAQRAGEVVREDETDADAGAAHSEAGETGADELRSGGIHVESSLTG